MADPSSAKFGTRSERSVSSENDGYEGLRIVAPAQQGKDARSGVQIEAQSALAISGSFGRQGVPSESRRPAPASITAAIRR